MPAMKNRITASSAEEISNNSSANMERDMQELKEIFGDKFVQKHVHHDRKLTAKELKDHWKCRMEDLYVVNKYSDISFVSKPEEYRLSLEGADTNVCGIDETVALMLEKVNALLNNKARLNIAAATLKQLENAQENLGAYIHNYTFNELYAADNNDDIKYAEEIMKETGVYDAVIDYLELNADGPDHALNVIADMELPEYVKEYMEGQGMTQRKPAIEIETKEEIEENPMETKRKDGVISYTCKEDREIFYEIGRGIDGFFEWTIDRKYINEKLTGYTQRNIDTALTFIYEYIQGELYIDGAMDEIEDTEITEEKLEWARRMLEEDEEEEETEEETAMSPELPAAINKEIARINGELSDLSSDMGILGAIGGFDDLIDELEKEEDALIRLRDSMSTDKTAEKIANIKAALKQVKHEKTKQLLQAELERLTEGPTVKQPTMF